MFERFRKYLEDKIVISENDYQLIESVSVVKKLRKHQFLLSEKIPPFRDMVDQLKQRSLNATHERINNTFISTPEEKYNHFLKSSPNLANRTPRHMLASYLGITPETLSRIRRQVSGK
jgi:CRP-like cAMP-binding protein